MAEVHEGGSRARQTVAIFLVSMAGLLLEVGYTRIVSYKLWYYYTYLVIGLALLGIGSGGIFVVLFEAAPRDRRPSGSSRSARSSARSASSIGYLVVSRIPSTRVSIWDYGTEGVVQEPRDRRRDLLRRSSRRSSRSGSSSRRSSAARRDGIGRLYFADLIGAGLGCLAAIPLITRLGPPDVIMLSALIFAVVGLLALPRRLGVLMGLGAVGRRRACVLIVDGRGHAARRAHRGHEGRPRRTRRSPSGARCSGSTSLVRRPATADRRAAAARRHASARRCTSTTATRRRSTRYDTDPRALPFTVLGTPPEEGADHRLGGRQRDPRVAALQARRRSRASSSTRSRCRCSPTTTRSTAATSATSPASASTRPTAAPTSRAATRSTTSSGTSRPTATPRTTPRRRARSCSRRATSTRRR